MFKLKKYSKPYIISLILGILLMFGQSFTSLELPNIMSDIVNIGIQMSGIDEVSPDAIDDGSFNFMLNFMSEEQKQIVANSYENLLGDELLKQQEVFTTADESTLFKKTDLSQEQTSQLDSAFSTSAYSLMLILSDLSATTNANTTVDNAQDIQNNVFGDISSIIPLIAQMPNDTLQAYIQTSLNTEDLMKQNVSSMFIKGFYQSIGANTNSMQTSYIFETGMSMILVCIVVVICAIAGGYFIAKFGAGVAKDLRLATFEKVTGFNNSELDKFSTASLITRTTNDITQVQSFLSMGLRLLFLAPLTGIGGIIMALQMAPSMTWIIALAIIIMLLIILILFIVAVPRFKVMQKLVDALNLVSRESLSGMMVIRAFSTQKFEEERFDKANKDLAGNMLFVNRAMATMMPTVMFIMNAIMLVIVWIGSSQIAASSIQVGDMMAFMQYAMQVVMSFLFISMMFIMMPRATVSAQRINEVLTTENSIKDPVSAKKVSKNITGNIEFKNVSFSYPGAEECVLQNISFTAKSGQTTAFIGSTGSGKSTLINLIPRFYDATKGSIEIDGINIKDISQNNLREIIGYVPQKGLLFSGDINSNLLYGDENADESLINEAAQVAQASEFIQKLDEGFNSPISQGGTNVSGGQRQRLSIARALVRKAPIYIFDDTFSALDFKTDAKLRKALKGYTQNATVLIVAQRVSTIMNAEQIVVLDEGNIVGIGTHKELLKNCTPYLEIAQSQLSKEELA